VRRFLDAAGWPEPVVADSGNGWHLLYKIDLPADDGGLVERILKALAKRFDTDAVTVDTSVFNPSRITKLYGTVSKKGDHTPNRPWRRSKIVSIPASIDTVPVDLLESLAFCAPAKIWKDATTGRPVTQAEVDGAWGPADEKTLKRARQYMGRVPGAVAGQHGHDATIKAANILSHRWALPDDQALMLLLEWNQGCQPPWDEDELRRKIDEAKKKPTGGYGELRREREKPATKRKKKSAGKPDDAPVNESQQDDIDSTLVINPEARTELANSRRWVERYGSEFRYVPEWDKLVHYDEGKWHVDHGEVQAMQRAKAIADAIWDETKQARTDETIDFAVKTAKHAGLRAMVNTARSDIAVSHDLFDSQPMLLNCVNGTVNLKTGELHPHRPDDYLMKMTATAFVADAPCARWEQFLSEVFRSKALTDFIRRLTGYILTGLTTEQVLPIFHGVGANGKTTFLTTVQDMLGDYAGQAPPALLTIKKQEQHPTELARLFGLRLAIATETEHGCRLAEAMVKQLTGSDRISARRMREDFWDFAPSHKLILCSNHRPKVKGTDFGIWRRLLLVPFNRIFHDGEKDVNLPAKLAAEATGILSWAVRGCLEWQRDGLAPPHEVQEATGAYRDEQDVLGRFIATCCLVGNDVYRVRFSQLYDALEGWCNDIGESLPSRKLCGEWLRTQGFTEKHSNGRWYVGLALKAEETVGG
jgi:P4 family phage/plasmid primase-like protien